MCRLPPFSLRPFASSTSTIYPSPSTGSPLPSTQLASLPVVDKRSSAPRPHLSPPQAILPPLLLLSAITPPACSPNSGTHVRLLLLLSSAGHYALLPLLHQPAEYTLSRALPLLYYLLVRYIFSSDGQELPLRWYERGYLMGFVPLEVFVSFLHPLLLAPRLPFLPLLATSVYCSFGVHMSTVLSFQLWLQHRSPAAAHSRSDSKGKHKE